MKTRWLCMIGLALVVCLGLAMQSPAKKPVKPPPDPEPEPGLPFSYQKVTIEPDPYWLVTYSINDEGVVAGEYETETVNSPVYAFTLAPVDGVEGVEYQAGSALTLAAKIPFDSPKKINSAGLVAGCYYESDWIHRAILWLQDGTGVDLEATTSGVTSMCTAINDAGLVTVFTESGNSYVVVPLDTDQDAEADTWVVDADGDGINDLLYPIAAELVPVAINASGQVLFSQGYLLTPDISVLTARGNPWQDGNAALEPLTPLPGYEETYTEAYDMNDAGTVVGTSNGRAVRWDDPGNPVDLGQPTKQSTEIRATHINNAGQIVGWCRDKKWGRSYFLIHEGQMYDLVEMGGANPIDMNNDGWLIDAYSSVYIPVYPEP